jgi:hypothetical protein
MLTRTPTRQRPQFYTTFVWQAVEVLKANREGYCFAADVARRMPFACTRMEAELALHLAWQINDFPIGHRRDGRWFYDNVKAAQRDPHAQKAAQP